MTAAGERKVRAMGEVEKAAQRVKRAMSALDTHRHEGAPTLEREYQRALEAYFVVAEAAAGRDQEAEDDGSELAELAEQARADGVRQRLVSVAGHYAAARRALRLARTYRTEAGSSGRRERECIEAALRHREAIRALRLAMRPAAEQLALPGLAKTRPEAAPVRIAQTG